MTHCIPLTLTTDEALLMSELFTLSENKTNPRKPSLSLIRVALNMIAEKIVTEETLIEHMQKWRTRANLADQLSRSEMDRALHFLKNPPPQKPTQPQAKPQPVRRVWVNPDANKRR